MPHPKNPNRTAFTLIELLVVISIIALLISMLLPSLSRARDQAKGVHCLARLKDIGTATVSYEIPYEERLPPAEWWPDPVNYPNIRYGWTEILFTFIYKEELFVNADDTGGACPEHFPVQRNVDRERFAKYFLCKASPYDGVNSGHYRVYLPFWAPGGGAGLNGQYAGSADPTQSGRRESLSPKAVLMGDANARSIRGSGDMPPEALTCRLGDDCSYIDAGEANESGPNGIDGNRFSDRHYGGTNFLYQDMHAEWQTRMREKLARDFDLNGVNDIVVGP